MTERVVLSIVVPVFNEAEVVERFHARLVAVLDRVNVPSEGIFVDDGSRDGTFERILQIRGRDLRVKALQLTRNFGHQAALTAGLDHASGEAVITMDGDLEHPPELIPDLLAKWRDGYQVVHTKREAAGSARPLTAILSRTFYRVFNALAQIELPESGPDYRLLDRRVVEALRGLPERARFIRGLSVWVGFRQTAVPFAVGERVGGAPGYSARKRLRLALEGMTSFSVAPLRAATLAGAAIAALAFLYGSYAIVMKLFTERSVRGWASVLAVVSFLSGLQLLGLGLVGEYIGRIYEEVKGRPVYLLSARAGLDEPRP